MTALGKRILEVLSKSESGLRASDIARELDVSRREVNQFLTYKQNKYVKTYDYRWVRKGSKLYEVDDVEEDTTNMDGENRFRYYNCNPHHVRTDDCVIRAIAAATGDTWEKTLKGLTAYMLKDGYMIGTPECYGKYLKDKGFEKHNAPHKTRNKTMTVAEFALQFNGQAIMNADSDHITYLSEGKIYDIWDCGDCEAGEYWTCK